MDVANENCIEAARIESCISHDVEIVDDVVTITCAECDTDLYVDNEGNCSHRTNPDLCKEFDDNVFDKCLECNNKNYILNESFTCVL